MRGPLAGVTVLLDGTPAPGSTTLTGVGAYVLVIATALPEQATTLTSCYLGRPDGALAVSHLRVGPDDDQLDQHVLAPSQLHATAAGACLLDHAATLRDTLDHAGHATVTVDVTDDALDAAIDAWGPQAPPG